MPNREKKKSMNKRWIMIGVLVFFATQIIISTLLVPKQAKALFGVGDVGVTLDNITIRITDAIEGALKVASDVAFKNILRSYLDNLAYNLATEIATGEKGQKPLFLPNPTEFLTQAGDAAAGDFLDSIASDWLGQSRCQGFSGIKCDGTVSQCPDVRLRCPDGVNIDCSSSVENKNKCLAAGCTIIQCNPSADGNECPEEDAAQDAIAKTGAQFNVSFGAPECVSSFSLCEPRDLTVKVQLNILARKSVLGEVGDVNISGKCPLTDIIDNFEKSVTEFDISSGKVYLAEFSKTFNPEATQLGAYLNIVNETKEAQLAQEKAAEFAKNLSGPISDVTSTISGAVKTPGTFLGKAATDLFGESIGQAFVYTGSAIADAVGVFTNTLTSKLIQRYVMGLDPATSTGGSGAGGLSGFFGFGGSSPGVTAAKILFADLQQTNYAVTGTTDILSSLSSCPDSSDPTPDTCVIDSRFRTAIEQQMTVREALNQGLLDGTKTFGFDANGLQPSYFNGYPLRSLMILRKYRIIPVGWELAAQYISNYARGNYSIATLINDYDNPNSPFYKLIDPNWVLKSPEVFCSREGAGAKIISSTPIRAEDTNLDSKIDTKDAASFLVQRQGNYCADEQLCLKENDDGSCRKYGYCIEEKPIFKLDGNVCDDQYNSCLALQDANGSSASYVLNSVDVNGCNTSNAGCQWYCTNYDNTLGDFTCSDTAPALPTDKISFNGQVGQCDSSSEGCNEFIRIKDSGANLLLNADFENFSSVASGIYDGFKDSTGAAPDEFDNWLGGGNLVSGNLLYADTDAFGGFTAARIRSSTATGFWPGTPFNGGNYFFNWPDPIDTGYLTNQRTFTTTFYAKRDSNDPECTSTAGELNLYYMRIQTGIPSGWDYVNVAQVFTSDTWTRYSGSATFPVVSNWASNAGENQFFLIVRKEATDLCDVIIDNIQVEEGGFTSFNIYEDSPKTYLKKAPDYLGCTADQSTNDPACGNFALFCSESEIGCEAFTSVSTGRTITGTITDVGVCDPNIPGSCDQCPAEFVGCQAFRELEINRSPHRTARDPVSFVSNSGLSCPASAVGCEEYTNLEEVAQGGEGKEYYSYIRMCVPETDPDVATYYSWEGSNEFGFQLRQYILKESNIPEGSGNFAPCTNIGAEGDPILTSQLGVDWPTCIDGTAVDRDLDTVDDEFYPSWSCTAAEVGLDPDCSEFYDTAGNQTYRLKSRLVFADASCKSYRNSIDGPDMTYHMVPGQGTQCSAVYAGCRAYKGNAGDNYREIYVESFENGTVDPWIGNVSYSNESINVSGHSMLVSNSAAIDNAGDSLGFQGDRSYSISFWAKSAVGVDSPISFSLNTAPVLNFTGQAVARSSDWDRFELGPLYIPTGVDVSLVQLILTSSNAFYIDNINISEVTDNIYLVKDTYTECSGYEGCDRYNDRDGSTHYLKSFTKLCGEDKVGCEVMIDTQNSNARGETQYQLNTGDFVRGNIDNSSDGLVNIGDATYFNTWIVSGGSAPAVFETADVNGDGVVDTSLIVGPFVCGVSTGNLDYDYLQEWLSSCPGALAPNPATVFGTLNGTVPADEFVFIVNDPAKSCSATQKGCQRLGQPNIDAEGNLQSFQNTYLVNNPDDYGTDLCLFNENSCQEYTSPGGSKYYFKDPGNSTCEFKLVTGQNVAGWYKKGTDTGSPDCPVVSGVCSGGGVNDGIACNSSDDCDSGFCGSNSNVVRQPTDGWVGQCPVAVSGCTEYRDPEAIVSSSGDILTANLLTNPGFENFVTTANAALATDGQIDDPVATVFVPDIFDTWDNRWTAPGNCLAADTITCSTDQQCPTGDTCNVVAGAPVACGNRLAAVSDSYKGDVAALVQSYDACGKGVSSSLLYTCRDVDTRAWVDGSGDPVTISGVTKPGCRNDSECLVTPNSYCQGDPAQYTWHGIDTGALTDNKAFQISFYAMLDPNDSDCVDSGANDDIFFGLTRGINNLPAPDGRSDYRPGFSFTDITDSWQLYQYTETFGSVDPGDWYNDIGPVEDLQNEFAMVMRRPRGGAGVCDVIIDNVSIVETVTPFDFASYYYIGGSVDQSSCNGLVNREEGCRLFNDTSDSSLPWTSAISEDGQQPELCSGPDCDSNSVIKVRQDRECKRWLECETSVQQTDAEGNVQDLCLSRFICDSLDELTGNCTNAADFENVDQTFTVPAFSDNIKNYSGLVLAGLDWERRCENDPNKTCTADNQCGAGGVCSPEPQIYQGSLPVSSMQEQGSVSIVGNLVNDGDMGDADYLLNQKLTCPLSASSNTCPDTALFDVNEIPLSDLSNNWVARDWFDGVNDIKWAEEDQNNGTIPSLTGNLDENNVARVKTSGFTGDDVDGINGIESAQWNGLAYDLRKTVVSGDEMYVTFRMRWAGLPSVYDLMRVEFGYRNIQGIEFNWLVFGDIVPTSNWQEYILGPVTVGLNNAGNPVSGIEETQLNFIHRYTGPDTVPPVEFYLDDISLRPVLQTQENGGLANRDCRLYPKVDAPYCTYTDENNTTYKGWTGYCLERDPLHQKYCLNWWPVDLLKGESDVFSSLHTAGYNERVPLYYCAESRDLSPTPPHRVKEVTDISGYSAAHANLPRVTCVRRTGGQGANRDACDIWAIMSDPKPLYYDIINDPATEWGKADWRIGQGWVRMDQFVEPFLFDGRMECEDGSGTCKDCFNIAGAAGNNNSNDGLDNVFCDFANRDTCGGTSFSGCATGGASPCESARRSELEATYHKVAYYHWRNANNDLKGCDDASGTQYYRLQGNATCALTDGGVSVADARCSNSIAGDIFDGWNTMDTNYTRAVQGNYTEIPRIPRPQECTDLVQVVEDDGTNVAWTSRLDGNFTLSNHPLQYTKAEQCSPYGGTPNISDPNDICIDWDGNDICNDRPPGEVPEYYPLQIYHPQNPFNNTASRVCDETIRGEGYYACGNWGTAGVSDICDAGTNWGLTPETGPNQGIDRIKRLFVDGYTYWQYNDATGRYVENNSVLTNAGGLTDDYKNMGTCPYVAAPGRAVRPIFDPVNPNAEYCGVPPLIDNILIGAGGLPEETSTVNLPGGGVIQMTFTVSADINQVPIREIRVDWGDGSPEYVSLGKFDSGTVFVSHEYIIPGDWTPKIKVIDNWMWCGVLKDAGSSCASGDCRYNVDGNDCTPPAGVDTGIIIKVTAS